MMKKTATAILQAVSAKYKGFLLNGAIPTVQKHHRNPGRPTMEFCLTKPLHPAAILHSHAMWEPLYESGVDVLQVDMWQNNVVYMLIFICWLFWEWK